MHTLTILSLVSGVLVILLGGYILTTNTRNRMNRALIRHANDVAGVMADGLLVFTGDGSIISANTVAEELLAAPSGGLISRNIGEFFDIGEVTPLSGVAGAVSSGMAKRIFSARTLSGKDIRLSISMIRSSEKHGMVCVFRNVTQPGVDEDDLVLHRNTVEERVAERTMELREVNEHLTKEINEHRKTLTALRKSETRYRTLVEMLPDSVLICDEDCRIHMANRTMVETFGYQDQQDLMSVVRTMEELILPEDRDRLHEDYRKVFDTGRIAGSEYHMQKRDGTLLLAELRVSLIPDMTGSHRMIIAVLQDVTIRKQLEEQSAVRRRIKSLTHLVGGIAHDFNNILTSVIGNLSLLGMDSDRLTENGRESLEEASRSLDLAANLVREFRLLVERDSEERRIVDLFDIIEDVVMESHTALGKNIMLRNECRKGEFHIIADRVNMNHAFLNIVTNAVQAIERKGATPNDAVVVTADEVVGGDEGVPSRLTPGVLYIHVAVTDTGGGMTPEVRHHAFDPLYTTHARNTRKGQGLGLAHAYAIITTSHHGVIDIESAKGRGTTVHIYLLRATMCVAPVEEIAAMQSFSVLVIDANASLRSMLERVLNWMGCTVRSAADCREGDAVFDGRFFSPDVVIIDETLYTDKIHARFRDRGNPKFVIMTDHAHPNESPHTDTLVRLIKPFSVLELLPLISGTNSPDSTD